MYALISFFEVDGDGFELHWRDVKINCSLSEVCESAPVVVLRVGAFLGHTIPAKWRSVFTSQDDASYYCHSHVEPIQTHRPCVYVDD